MGKNQSNVVEEKGFMSGGCYLAIAQMFELVDFQKLMWKVLEIKSAFWF